ncbi:MAG TPA: preprotein translocase subunit SecG [Nitrospinota bacterium]|jgi:preprotein translocase subunit SecG|nr:preprotein translocase subunit SecG [Nitrospinota bacterium]|tara:strand:+ start:4905 stop:5315 length:411 start_codon:yes stop_codon:yes gene_type:complete
MFETLTLVVHIVVALALIVTVLFQQGSKGAAMGSAFGGSSQTVFGSRGPATAMARITTLAAVIFMLTAITLSVLSNAPESSVISDVKNHAVELPVSLPDQNQAISDNPKAEPTGPTVQNEEPTGPIGPVDSDSATN